MGNRQSEQEKANRRLDRELKRDKRKHPGIRKLLILGDGNTGKSAIFKQFRSLHGSGFSREDRLQYKDRISGQIMYQMTLCLECLDILKEDDPDEFKDLELSDQGKQAADTLYSSPTSQVCLYHR